MTSLARTEQPSHDTANLSPSVAARHACRSGMAATTAGVANGFVQGNLVILPEKLAASFLRFCQQNPNRARSSAFPKSVIQEFRHLVSTSTFAPICQATASGRMGIWSTKRPTYGAWWRDDLVSFVLGCSFSFEQALIEDGLPMRHMSSGVTVPMYRTDIACVPAGPFWGPMVVSMRPFKPAHAIRAIQITSRFPAVHGAPIHIGLPELIGIQDLAKPDYGDASSCGR